MSTEGFDSVTLARLEQLATENLELAEETNQLLRDMRRLSRVAFWAKAVMWLIVIVLPFILLKPIVNALVPLVGGNPSSFGLPSSTDIQALIREYQSSKGGQ